MAWILDKLWDDPPKLYTVPVLILFVGCGIAWAALALIAWRARRAGGSGTPEAQP